MPKTAEQLSKLISPSNITTKPGTSYFIGSKSASTTEDDEIYISCQPIGDSSNGDVEGFQTILKKETDLQNITKILLSSAVLTGLLLISCRINRK